MSFSAVVKNELARVAPVRRCCRTAELAAILHIDGTLRLHGGGRCSLEVATENAAVARRVVADLHELFELQSDLVVRRNTLTKTNNYLIEIPDQPRLAQSLNEIGVLDDSMNIVHGVLPRIVKRNCCAVAYLRGAFLGGGSVADPRGEYHFEIDTQSEQLAQDLKRLLARFGMDGRVRTRRDVHVLYMKDGDSIIQFLALVGAHAALLTSEDVRVLKQVRAAVNRLVNMDTANVSRAVAAAAQQLADIRAVQSGIGLRRLPPALREIAQARLAHPEASLTELGEMCAPRLTKSAVNHRMRRISGLAAKIREGQ